VGFPEQANECIKRLYSEIESSQKLAVKVWLGNYLPKTKNGGEECFIVWAKNTYKSGNRRVLRRLQYVII
jgi:hypothetical protein